MGPAKDDALGGPAGADEAGFVGEHDEPSTVAGVEFGEYPADVGAGGGGAEVEPVGNLLVGETLGDEGEHLAFAIGEPVQFVGGSRLLGAAGELGDQAAGHVWGDQRVTLAGGAHRGDELTGLGVLEEKADGAVAKRVEEVLVESEGGEDHDPHLREVGI